MEVCGDQWEAFLGLAPLKLVTCTVGVLMQALKSKSQAVAHE